MFWYLCAEWIEFLSQRRSRAVLMKSRHEEGQTVKQGLYQRKRGDRVLTTFISDVLGWADINLYSRCAWMGSQKRVLRRDETWSHLWAFRTGLVAEFWIFCRTFLKKMFRAASSEWVPVVLPREDKGRQIPKENQVFLQRQQMENAELYWSDKVHSRPVGRCSLCAVLCSCHLWCRNQDFWQKKKISQPKTEMILGLETKIEKDLEDEHTRRVFVFSLFSFSLFSSMSERQVSRGDIADWMFGGGTGTWSWVSYAKDWDSTEWHWFKPERGFV